MALAERGDDVLEQVDFADADAVEPDAGGVADAQQSAAGELAPQAAFADEPRETKNEGDTVDEVQEVGHRNPFRQSACGLAPGAAKPQAFTSCACSTPCTCGR